MATDFYRVLGIRRDASDKEIKAAFRKLAREYHPDVNPGDAQAEERFKEISQAHEVLGDTKNRRAYDKYGDQWQHADQIEKQHRQAGTGFAGFSRAGGFPGSDGQTFTFEGGLGNLFRGNTGGSGLGGNDIFSNLFNRSTGRQKGQDLEHTVNVSLQDAYHGAKRTIQLNTSEGAGSRLEIDIPAGVNNGQRIRISGKGSPGVNGGGAGDLFLLVRLESHAQFQRDGDNLRVVIDVSVLDAVLGGEVLVTSLKGNSLVLRIPPDTQAGKLFRLAGQGMPKQGGRGFGDLLVEIRIVIPEPLTQEQRKIFEMLRSTEADSQLIPEENIN